MFWGLVLEPGKRYSTTVDKSFHVSMAALDCSSVKSDSDILSVILESEGQENILCNLSKKILQSHLDLNFMTGDKVAFEVKGCGIIHLSGYLVPDDDEDDYTNMQDLEDMEDEEEEEEDEEAQDSPNKNAKEKQKGKRKSDPPQVNDLKKKKLKMAEESDEESDEEDDDEDDDEDEGEDFQKLVNSAPSSEEDDDDDDDSDEEEDDDSDEDNEGDSDDEEEEVQIPSKKQQKTPQSVNKKQQNVNKQTPKQQQSASKQNVSTPLVNGSGPNQQQSNKKNKNKGQETPKTPNQNDIKSQNQKTPGSESQKKKKLEGGVVVKDIKEGTGQVAKTGQLVSVYYQGRLKVNNKMFDECKRGGPAFKFRLGKGEVIKGWDIGVSGMKVGGIRSITCPPNMAYGQKGSPPQIPPNSHLVFQVELKAVN